MVNKPASSIYSIVEKAYFRLQAGDVLTHCLEDGSTEPIHEMIQEMVLAGPKSLDALREILGEAIKRKGQVYDDLNQLTHQLSVILQGYGISLERLGGNLAIQSLNERKLLIMLDEENIVDDEERSGCVQILKDTQELIAVLTSKIRLLENIETYLQDWLWGLTYQYIKLGEDETDINSPINELQ
jgi:hypothetical protein